MSAPSVRILITGSRDWADKNAIGRAIMRAIGDYAAHLIVDGDEFGPRLLWDRVTIVHGAARGADTMADRIGRAWGMRVEPHEVTRQDWDTCGPECKQGHRRRRPDGTTYCPSAANRRNQRMVDLGATVCLGFPVGFRWSGTRDCMTRAEKAGIPVVDCSAVGVS